MNAENVSNPTDDRNECRAAIRHARASLVTLLADLHHVYETGRPQADLLAPVSAIAADLSTIEGLCCNGEAAS